MFWPKPQWLDMDRSWRMVFDLPNIQFSFQPHLEEYELNNLDWQHQLRNHEWKKFRGVQLNDVHYLCLKHKMIFLLSCKKFKLWNSFFILFFLKQAWIVIIYFVMSVIKYFNKNNHLNSINLSKRYSERYVVPRFYFRYSLKTGIKISEQFRIMFSNWACILDTLHQVHTGTQSRKCFPFEVSDSPISSSIFTNLFLL